MATTSRRSSTARRSRPRLGSARCARRSRSTHSLLRRIRSSSPPRYTARCSGRTRWRRSVFGDTLVTAPVEGKVKIEQLPSPEDLKGRGTAEDEECVFF
ncbi:hypothetical protein CONPUDRAFT_108843 [Coniophora puteana RWD-64-598 SS2]|uniref:Uncharacterized protein n=1 Tax=Coniophora puteana (strain RWD-64-598) TaxID=741705 RepID=A0A5M3MED8_CONPW|nr:uncharacterized protein CONPUDRAFT_108843 [Coniophora puteana RWD-64-598 SS2]EIW77588.1 hypothetical protein CONPUDRAFT_108843 [Coniophora puteana RWD-64-598 SS2]